MGYDMTLEELQAQYDTLQAQNADLAKEKDSIAAKNAELLGETKKAKEKRKAAEAQAQKEAADKALKAGDFEQLLKSSEEQRLELEARLNGITEQTNTEKRNAEAYKLAARNADGANAELLSEFIAKRIKIVDGEAKVLDKTGALTVSSLADLEQEFIKDEKYKSLLRGNLSSGGGATGGNGQTPSGKLAGNLSGKKSDRIAALNARFPELNNT